MRRPGTWSLLVLLAACDARINGAPGDLGSGDASVDVDASGTPPATDAMLGAWSIATTIPQAATPASSEDDATLSSSTLEMIFAIDGGANGKDLYYTSRPSTSDPWTTATKLGFNVANRSDETPRFSADDKTLYFASDRGTQGNLDIYAVTRPAAGSTTWGLPAVLTGINTTLSEKWYMPCGTHYIMARATVANGTDLVEGTLGAPAAPIAALNSPQNETGTFLTADCLTIYFASTRPGPATPSMIYTSHRDAITAPWQPPAPVTDLRIAGGNGSEEDPWMSADGRTFVFASDAAGTKDIYLSTR
jgi:WD40 repeat protein